VSQSLGEIVGQASESDAIASQMRSFYAELDQTIAAHAPVCTNRGACCQFGRYGHRLYVTSVELGYFVRGLRAQWRPPAGDDACPYQVGGMCTAREHRPMGCRVFFCDPNAQHWQNEEYERQLAALKRIGAEHDVEYRYVEWLSALSEIEENPGANLGISRDFKPVFEAPESVDPPRGFVLELTQVRQTDSHRQQGAAQHGGNVPSTRESHAD